MFQSAHTFGSHDFFDPTFVLLPPSWSTDPDDWEGARAQLINIIVGSEVIDPGSL